MLNIALRAARKAGDLVARAAEQIDRLKIESKGENDFVTEINLSVPGDTIFVKALSNDQTKSIVNAVDKLVSRVVKFKETRFSKI